MLRKVMTGLLERTSFLTGANSTFVAEMYARYLEKPAMVDPEWSAFFEELKPINQSNLAMRNITTRASCIAVLLDVVDSKLADGPWIDRSTE